MLGRARREHHRDGGEHQEPEPQEADASSRQEVQEEAFTADAPIAPERSSEGVKDYLELLAGQIKGLQRQVEQLAARRNDVTAEHASQRVAAIVQAAEDSAAAITAEAHAEAAELRERLRAEAQAEAGGIRINAQAEASKIRTEAHAAAAVLRKETVDEVRREVEGVCALLAQQLQTSAREAMDRVARSPDLTASTKPAPGPETLAGQPDRANDVVIEEGERANDVDVEEAVGELQSAAAVLEQSLRHLHEIGRELPEQE